MNTRKHPVDIFAFCPKCGSPGFETTGPRSKRCANCSFNYFFNTAAAASALIFDAEGRLMLTRRGINPHKGKLDLPGGFVEYNESAEEAIKRELYEELGAEVSEISYFGTFPNQYEFSDMIVHTLDSTFIIKLKSLDKLKPQDDVAGIEFWPVREINIDDIQFRSMQATIRLLQQPKK